MKAHAVAISLLIAFVVACSQLSLAPVDAAQAPLTAKQQAVIDAAKKDGTFEIIATWRPQEAKAIFNAFKEAYPFIKVEQTMMAGAVGFERLRAEFASGRRTTDLINTSLLDLEKAGHHEAKIPLGRRLRRVPAGEHILGDERPHFDAPFECGQRRREVHLAAPLLQQHLRFDRRLGLRLDGHLLSRNIDRAGQLLVVPVQGLINSPTGGNGKQ